jgi:hypothetical protein
VPLISAVPALSEISVTFWVVCPCEKVTLATLNRATFGRAEVRLTVTGAPGADVR